ncbi:MAG: protein adenylyltransferase SelO family protein [Proteobacteria bacterium]|nr:protein adenylyltransferase SelO family protein [Pseudomonadota bacterium]
MQLKGAGRTVFSRGGDGRAAIGPVLREYLLSEAMFALGVPTTRALCAVATGETINRDGPMPGAVLTRVALSHLRVGTFEYFAIRKDIDALAHLVNYALNRLYPEHSGAESGALVLLDAVIAAQAELLAQWMGLGFVHGVMTTDNTAISGQTLDYGPCAFLDTFKEDRVFSSIDRQGRYAFANQAHCALWNMERLAAALQPLLVHELGDTAKLRTLLSECLESFAERFQSAYLKILRKKLGLASDLADDSQLASVFLRLMSNQSIDYTLCFRQLTELSAAGDDATFLSMFENHDPIKNWLQLWRQRCALDTLKSEDRAARMRAINPAFIPRNHRVEEALAAAARGDMTAFERLLKVLSRPYEDQAEAIDLATPPGPEQWQYKTFCGT